MHKEYLWAKSANYVQQIKANKKRKIVGYVYRLGKIFETVSPGYQPRKLPRKRCIKVEYSNIAYIYMCINLYAYTIRCKISIIPYLYVCSIVLYQCTIPSHKVRYHADRI